MRVSISKQSVFQGIIFLSTICFANYPATGQKSGKCDLIFKGLVIDGETNKPFPGATVIITQLQKGATTDQAGEFEISGICAGQYTVRYSFIGYKSIEHISEIGENTFEKVILHVDTCSLASVTVVGEPDASTDFIKNTLTQSQLEKSSGLMLGEILKEIPGVSVYQTGPSIIKPVIHGMHSNRILIMNHGLRQEGQQWGTEHAPEIDPFAANKITVIKGAAGVKYGTEALGGVILIEPKDLPGAPGVNAEVQMGAFSNNGMGVISGLVEGANKKLPSLAWRVQGTVKQAGDVRTPTYVLSNTAFEERNFSYQVGYNKTKWGINFYYSQFNTKLGIAFSAQNGSTQDLLRAITRGQPSDENIRPFSYEIRRGYQVVEHELAKATVYAYPWEIGKVSLVLGYQFNSRSEYDRHKPYNEAWKEKPQLLLELKSYSSEISYEHKRLNYWSGSVGFQSMVQSNAWDGRFLIPNFTTNAVGAYVIEKWRKYKTEFEFGIRYDFRDIKATWYSNSTTSENALSFARPTGLFGINYYANAMLTWRNAIGAAFRPPSVNELYSFGYHQGAASFEYGLSGLDQQGKFVNGNNTNIAPEQGYKWVSALVYMNERFGTDVCVYANYISDFIYLQPIFPPQNSIRGAYPTFKYRQANAIFYGVDLSAEYAIHSDLKILFKSSIVNAWNYGIADYMIYTPPYRFEGEISYAPSMGKFTKKYRPTFGLRCQHVVKQQFIPTSYDTLLQLPANESLQIVGGDYMAPPEGYTIFGAEMGMRIPVGTHHIHIYLQASNIFDLAYRNYLDRYRYYADQAGRNFSLRIKIPLTIYKPKSHEN